VRSCSRVESDSGWRPGSTCCSPSTEKSWVPLRLRMSAMRLLDLPEVWWPRRPRSRADPQERSLLQPAHRWVRYSSRLLHRPRHHRPGLRSRRRSRHRLPRRRRRRRPTRRCLPTRRCRLRRFHPRRRRTLQPILQRRPRRPRSKALDKRYGSGRASSRSP